MGGSKSRDARSDRPGCGRKVAAARRLAFAFCWITVGLMVAPAVVPSARAQEALYGPPANGSEGPIGGLENPPGIDEALSKAAAAALATYPSLGASRSLIRAADHEIEAAQWLRFPSFDASLETRDDKLAVPRPDITIFQPLWAGGRISAARQRGVATKAVAEAQLDEVSYDILSRLAEAYYEIGRTARLAAIYEDSLEEHRRLVDSMARRVEQEVSPRTDLDLARTRYSQTEQELGLLRTQLGIARRRFSELSGATADSVAPARYDPVAHHAVGEAAIEVAAQCNPRVRRLDALVALAEAEQKVAKAQVMPQLGAQYVRDRFGGDQVGIALRAQTNGGLSGFALAEAAAARREASLFDALTARRELREALALELIENSSAKARIESSGRSASTSLSVAQSYLRQFVAGRRTWLDVMNSVREAVAARAALIEAETSAMTTSAQIQLQSCAWYPAGPATGVR